MLSMPSCGGSSLLQALTDDLKAWHVLCQLNVTENEVSQHKTDFSVTPPGAIQPDL